MAVIKQLSPVTINRIAAGEVIERPASAVKELVENALDAGATEVRVVLESAGKNLIMISDNGHGIDRDGLSLAVERHTTSKLQDDDLINIRNFGFRGEALPAIGSVSRMTIKSRLQDEDSAWQLSVIGGQKGDLIPASHPKGTTIEVRDLFFATPARLKFLKTDRTEVQNIVEVIKRIAIAHPHVAFTVISDDKVMLDLAVQDADSDFTRMAAILGKDFAENSIALNRTHEDIKISGYTSLPTYDRGTSDASYLYINNRPVKDKLLYAAIRVAYHDFISRDRYPSIVLFLDVPYELVDVNVHPAKAEVRFRDSNMVKNSIIAAIKSAILDHGQKSSTTIASSALGMIKPANLSPNYGKQTSFASFRNDSYSRPSTQNFTSFISEPNVSKTPYYSEPAPSFIEPVTKSLTEDTFQQSETQPLDYPLGAAKCQLHKTYIVSQTDDSIVITDQHAAHERLIYEKLKAQFEQGEIFSQRLLVPEIIESDEDTIVKLLALRKDLQKLGLIIDVYTTISISLHATPAILGNCDAQKLMQDIIDDLKEYDENVLLQELVNKVLSTYACHHSIRAGREMHLMEMNGLLREMESTPHSGQCNHGRPTYVELKLKDIEKLFGRS